MMSLRPLRPRSRREIANFRRPIPKNYKKAAMPKIVILDQDGRWNRHNEDELLWWPRVLWIDPGVVSGVAVIWFDPVAMFSDKVKARQILAYSEQFLSGPEDGPNGQANRFLRLRRTLAQETGLATGIESFTIRQFNQDEDFLSPVRLRSKLSFAASIATPPWTLHSQSPSDAITAFTNNRLQALNMYTPGPDHVNDAKRHTLLWMSKIRDMGRHEFEVAHGAEPGWWK